TLASSHRFRLLYDAVARLTSPLGLARRASASFLMAACLVFAVAGAALAQDGEPDLLLLEVRLGPYRLSEAMTAYQGRNVVLLPLGELSRLLTIGIATDPEKGAASGFVLDEQREFQLDVHRRMVTIADRSMSFQDD